MTLEEIISSPSSVTHTSGGFVIAAASVGLFFLGWLIRLIRQYYLYKRGVARFVIALHSEVDLNTSFFQNFLSESLSNDEFKSAMKKKFVCPHYVFAPEKRIYDSQIDLLINILPNSLKFTIRFYAAVDRINRQIQSMQERTFQDLPIRAKIEFLVNLRQTIAESAQTGETVLKIIEHEYRQYELERFRGL